MAMIDYGAIAWEDGKLIQTEMFEDMESAVGWSNDALRGNYFTYIGDEDLTLCFYKKIMKVYVKDSELYSEDVYFGFEKFRKWKYWHHWFFVNDEIADIKVRKRFNHDYYICKLKYKGHKYKVAFGYGVDLGYYKKTHIVDYYGTPWFRVRSWFRNLKDKYEDWRYTHGR